MKAPDLNIRNKKQEPFKVPADYFDNLTTKMMEAIDQSADATEAAPQEADHKKRVPFYKTELYAKVKPYLYMAVMFGGLYFGMWVFKYQQSLSSQKQQAIAKTEAAKQDSAATSADEEYEYINDACDFMMMDSHDIMACVTGEDR